LLTLELFEGGETCQVIEWIRTQSSENSG
jgi:hypothetical protein